MGRIIIEQKPGGCLKKISIILLLLFSLCSKNANAKKQGKALADSLFKVLPGVIDDTNKANIFNKLGTIYSSIAPDTGIKFGLAGLALARKLNWEDGIGTAFNIIGICFAYKSDYSRSLVYWDSGLKIFQAQNNKKGVLKIVGNIGLVYESQGNYSRALENNMLALKSAEELGDKNSISINLGNIGADYEYLKDYKKALEYDLSALKIDQELGDTQRIAGHLCNIGNIYNDKQNYALALEYQKKALLYNEQLGNSGGIVRDWDNIGNIYKETGKYDSSLKYLFKALELSRTSGLKAGESKALSFLGEVLVLIDTAKEFLVARLPVDIAKRYNLSLDKKSLIKPAIEFINESISIDIETTNLNELQQNYHNLSEAQRIAGNYKGALESTDKYIAVKDSVFSTDGKIKITNLETKRELDLKDKQLEIDKLEAAKRHNERLFFMAGITLLLIVIGIIIRNMKLAAAKDSSENKLNAFQARMNPHFIFNSLSSIQSLVMNNENDASIDYLSEFSTLMRQILDSSARSKVPLKTEIEMLRSYIQLEHLRFDCFTWNIHIAENVREDAAEVPGMIVQPFVENAILHGLVPKGEKGVLSITFEENEKHIICTVDDNGIGRDKSYELNQKRSKDHQSHGVDIATNRLTLLNNKKRGLINKVIYNDKTENGMARGTKVIIQIPIL